MSNDGGGHRGPAGNGGGRGDRIRNYILSKLRSAGRQYGQARDAYGTGKALAKADIPTDDDGNARIVCRRYAERRTVELDATARPDCFEPGHQDCQGCLEDIREGRIETWSSRQE